VIAPPEPDLTPEDLVRRASAMVQTLRERQAECERLGRIPQQTNDEFVAAGFYRILQPRRFGGYEFGMPTFARVMMEVSRGCASSGWVLALTGGHAIMLSAFFSEQAQIDVYGTDGEFRGPSRTPPYVVAQPVDGGYILNGEWNYVSGCDIATHVIGGIKVVSEAGEEPRVGIVDRRDVTIVDDWDTIGMRGTGSRRVVVRDAFIPEYRTIPPMRDAFGSRNAPGRRVHANPVYVAGRLVSVLFEEMAAVAVGLARGALDVYERELCSSRLPMPPYALRSETPEYQRHFGEAFATIQTAEATVMHIAEKYMEFARQDVEEEVPFSDERDLELQLLEQYATRLAGDAVDLMFRTAGTHVAQSNSMLQRYFRDMAVLKTHIAAQTDRGAESFGREHFSHIHSQVERT
jgi:3-hydroxy-9,10-secoandrosta-1,3,5(10)-triene-9,17-dione monooxygenase